MAHQLEILEGLDTRTVRATVRGRILALSLTAPLTVPRIVHDLGMTERQVRFGLAHARKEGVINQGKSVLPRVTFRGISVVPPVLSAAIQGTPDARTARSTPWIEDSWLDGFSRAPCGQA